MAVWRACRIAVMGDESNKEEGYGMAKLITAARQTKKEKEPALKGTLASVFLLGFFIIFSWVSVYFLFLHRL